LHLSQIFFTDGWTFTGAALIPVDRSPLTEVRPRRLPGVTRTGGYLYR